jgi:hypothetical protein
VISHELIPKPISFSASLFIASTNPQMQKKKGGEKKKNKTVTLAEKEMTREKKNTYPGTT